MTCGFIQTLVLALAIGAAQETRSEFFEVPNGLIDLEGNAASRLPFGYPSPVHYHQVFDASQFARLPPGGAFLSWISFRPDCSSTFTWLVTNLQLNLSTTLKTPDNLSAVFSQNIGSDETLVFGPENYIPPGSTSPTCPGPDTFLHGQIIELAVPFFYDPEQGNLLIDLRHLGNSWKFGDPRQPDVHKLDAQDVLGDSVSRVAAFSLSTNTAEIVDTTGLVTAFRFDPYPSLSIRFETNILVVTFPLYPTAFVLQWSNTVGPGPEWQNYPGQIEQIGFDRIANIPLSSLQASKYFRLLLNMPQLRVAGRESGSAKFTTFIEDADSSRIEFERPPLTP
jgi:hypothetical protein